MMFLVDVKAKIVLTNNFSYFFSHSSEIFFFNSNIFSLAACNRTLYGETGKTYELEIRKPKVFPFVCHLNFTAPGGLYGDIIQVRNLYNGLYTASAEICFSGLLVKDVAERGVGQRFLWYLCCVMVLCLSAEKV